MNPLRVITRQFGFFTRREAKAAGYADREITRMVRSRVWVRIRRGYYVFADDWLSFDPVARHQVRSRAVLHSLGDAVALSHVSGVIAHGIDTWGINLDRVHVTRLDGGAGRIEGDVVHHEGFCLDEEVSLVDGLRVLPPERCVIEAGSRAGNAVALCLFEAGLRAGAYDNEQLESAYDLMRHWPFAHHLVVPVSMADGRSGSIGESRGRWFFYSHGIPTPDLQYAVHRPDGSLAGVTDWAWRDQGVLGEFDGQVKYGRLLRPGQDPSEVVFAEKRREDELRELTGNTMIRLTWTDYGTPEVTAARLRQVLRIAG